MKVESYTHSHYNLLFLTLTEESMKSLKQSQKDIDAHWLTYKIDLRDPSSIPQDKLDFVNLMKGFFYKVFKHFNQVNEETANEFKIEKMKYI